jgi:hypothetical protein
MSEESQVNDLLTEIKKKYMVNTLNLNVEEVKKEAEKDKETITLYQGTTSNRLNSILREGILPRKETGIDNWNWDGDKSSIENEVYMTNKWHYFYAFNSWGVYLKNIYGEDLDGLRNIRNRKFMLKNKEAKLFLFH